MAEQEGKRGGALVTSTDSVGVEAQEHLALVEDRRSFPTNFALRLKLRGAVDKARLTLAVERTLLRHGLLRSTLVGNPDESTTKLLWRFGPPDATAVLRWEHDTDPPLAIAPFDLSAGPGLRLCVRAEQGETTLLWAEFHAAVCDIFAASRFVEEILCYYHDPETGERLLPAIEPPALHRRGALGLTPGELRSRVVGDVAAAWRFFRGRSGELASPRLAPAEAPQFRSGSATFTVDNAELEEIGNGARTIGATVHELLVRELAATVRDWNERHPSPRVHAPLRVSWLVDLRKLADYAMPAANMAGVLYHDFPSQSAGEDAVANDDARLVSTMRLQQHRGDALSRASLARALGRFPSGVARLTRPPFLRGGYGAVTLAELPSAFANAKLPRDASGHCHAGNLTLEAIELLPSLHPGTPVGFGVVHYGGRMLITAHAGGPRFGTDEAQALLVGLVHSLRGAMVSRDAFAKLFEDRLSRAKERRPDAPLWSLPMGKRSRI